MLKQAHPSVEIGAAGDASHAPVKPFCGTAMKCYWCDRPFQARQSGGHAQRFCSPSCRLVFHAAARRWTLDAVGAGVLSIADLKKGIQPTCMLPETASAAAPISLCPPAHIVDHIAESIAAGGAQIKREAVGAVWEIKRQDARSRERRNGQAWQSSTAIEREWGGEVAVKTYCTAAVAQMLLKHLGRDLSAFLAIADCADLGQVMTHLHAASLVQANAAPSKRGDGKPIDEPPLPFVN